MDSGENPDSRTCSGCQEGPDSQQILALPILQGVLTVVIKLFNPERVRDYRCDQCLALPTLDSPAISQRFLLSLPRFLRVNITSALTSQRLPEDFHKHGPLWEFERLKLSQLSPQLQPTQASQGLYVLRAAIMLIHV